jgi:hypothetical protein
VVKLIRIRVLVPGQVLEKFTGINKVKEKEK